MYDQLSTGETCIIKSHQHKIIFLEPMLWFMLASILAVVVILNALDPWLWVIPGVFYLWGWIRFFGKMIAYLSTKYIVTNERIIRKTGIFAREAMELMIDKCEGVMVSQSVCGRLLNYGSITVTTGEVSNCYEMMSDPLAFRDAINQARRKREPNAR